MDKKVQLSLSLHGNPTVEQGRLAHMAFHLIELVEAAGISGQSHALIRKKLLNLGNDILRLPVKEDGE